MYAMDAGFLNVLSDSVFVTLVQGNIGFLEDEGTKRMKLRGSLLLVNYSLV